MKKVLVFGGFGFLGYYLVCELLNRGYVVTVADIYEKQKWDSCSNIEKFATIIEHYMSSQIPILGEPANRLGRVERHFSSIQRNNIKKGFTQEELEFVLDVILFDDLLFFDILYSNIRITQSIKYQL